MLTCTQCKAIIKKAAITITMTVSISILLTVVAQSSSAAEAQQGNQEALNIIGAALSEGLDPNHTETDDTSLLLRAVHNRNLDLVRLLLESGADVAMTNRYGMAPLILAVRGNDLDITRLLLTYGADANTLTVEGESALMSAAKIGNVEIVRVLLEGNSQNYSPRGDLILTSKADPNIIEGWKGQTAIMWASAYGHAEVVKLLVDAGALKDQPSFVVNVSGVSDGYYQGGFVYTSIPKGRMTALHFAAREGQFESVRTLIESGADLDVLDDDKSNALVLAILNGHLDVAGLLIEAGADLNLADRWGRTALFMATDLNTLDANPWPAPKKVSTLTPVGIVAKLLEHGAEPNPLLKTGLPNWVQVGGGHNPILKEGATPFLRAAMSGDTEITDLLLAAGADAMLGTIEREGFTDANDYFIPSNGATLPFMVAAGVGWRPSISRGSDSGSIEILNMLLEEYSADINAANQFGDTPLHGAVNRGSAEIVRFLVERGADVNAKNSRDLTPMDLAVGQPEFSIDPNPAIADLLLELTLATQ